MIELKGKTFNIFGLKGTGKSELLKHIARTMKPSIIYDTIHEQRNSKDYDIYQPQHRYNTAECEQFIMITLQSKYKMIGIDEANRFAHPHPTPLPPAFVEANDMSRHYGKAIGFIARRPTQLHTDLVELAAYLFIFNLKGKNDILYLNNLSGGLGDIAVKLPAFHFVTVNPDRTFSVNKPIPIK